MADVYVHATVTGFAPGNRYRVIDEWTVAETGWVNGAGLWGLPEESRQVCPVPVGQRCQCVVVQRPPWRMTGQFNVTADASGERMWERIIRGRRYRFAVYPQCPGYPGGAEVDLWEPRRGCWVTVHTFRR